MDDKMLEKRMELLNNNYKRMPGQTDVSNVLKAIENEQKPKKSRRKLIHWPYAASFIGVLLISSVLVFQFTGSQEGNLQNGQQSVMTSEEVAKNIEEIEKHYKVRRMQAMGSLGLTEEGFRQTEMGTSAEAYVSYAKQTIKDGRMSMYEGTDTVAMINSNVDDILKTPAQMITGLTGKSLSKEKADLWVKNYLEVQKGLLSAYEAGIEQHRKEWETEIQQGRLEERDILLERKKQYSDKLITLAEGAVGNGISLDYSQSEGRFSAKMDAHFLKEFLSSSELPEVYMNVLTLEGLPASLNGGVITTNWVRAGGDLLLYESVLENLPPGSEFLEQFRIEYSTLLRAYVKGSSSQSIFNDEGVLKEDVKESFEKLMEKYPDSKTAARIQPYYNKLMENQFAKPENWDGFYMEYEL
ncbi:hypothetical protein D3H55_00220 [Bacillus salacetis]|uniref:DUF3600 domain-containing protein n=1 Tax=Bacillus salacetis TaxID=2315464 RepID=A0A3A1R6K8_9BACI|nr:hypothetical protein [Bacillus salacetis]RIW38821.1 hypothetical protein D3H55_00220 [Bacillus salacetis]